MISMSVEPMTPALAVLYKPFASFIVLFQPNSVEPWAKYRQVNTKNVF